MQNLARWLLLVAGVFNILFGLLFLGPTGAKDNFFKLIVTPKIERANQVLSESLKADEVQSIVIKKTLQMIMMQDFVTFIVAFSTAMIALGVSFIALSRTFRTLAQTSVSHTKLSN